MDFRPLVILDMPYIPDDFEYIKDLRITYPGERFLPRIPLKARCEAYITPPYGQTPNANTPPGRGNSGQQTHTGPGRGGLWTPLTMYFPSNNHPFRGPGIYSTSLWHQNHDLK